MATSIGANDVANAMGTSVGSGALRLGQAVMIAAALEFSGALLFGSHVSATMQRGIVSPDFYSAAPKIFVFGMFAALLSAGSWLQVASYFGWPVSTTHSIVGAIIGFGLISGGKSVINWEQVTFIVSSWMVSPALSALLAYGIFNLFRLRIFYSPSPYLAAKRLIPFVVFLFVSILALLLTEKLFTGKSYLLLFSAALGIGIFSGIIVALLLMRSKEILSLERTPPAYPSELAHALRKAKKHLLRVQEASKGEMHYHAGLLVDEVDHLSTQVSATTEVETPSTEFEKVERLFGWLQILSASTMAFAHGANDVANAIGPLTAAIQVLQNGVISTSTAIPTWALTLGGSGIIVGLALWGWRVIETIGKKITELTPTRGFSAEFGAAITILLATRLGLPISTTHTLVGAVVGVGLARGIGALNLGMAREILLSWLITVPAGALLSISFFTVIQGVFG